MNEDAPTDAAPKRRSVGKPFEKGNKLGKGNPLAKRQADYRKLFAKAITDEAMEAVAQAMVLAALKGDVQAARLIMEYTAGKPQAAEVEEDGDAKPVSGRIEIRFVPAAAVVPS
jgi:hypothetical protein